MHLDPYYASPRERNGAKVGNRVQNGVLVQKCRPFLHRNGACAKNAAFGGPRSLHPVPQNASHVVRNGDQAVSLAQVSHKGGNWHMKMVHGPKSPICGANLSAAQGSMHLV